MAQLGPQKSSGSALHTPRRQTASSGVPSPMDGQQLSTPSRLSGRASAYESPSKAARMLAGEERVDPEYEALLRTLALYAEDRVFESARGPHWLRTTPPAAVPFQMFATDPYLLQLSSGDAQVIHHALQLTANLSLDTDRHTGAMWVLDAGGEHPTNATLICRLPQRIADTATAVDALLQPFTTEKIQKVWRVARGDPAASENDTPSPSRSEGAASANDGRSPVVEGTLHEDGTHESEPHVDWLLGFSCGSAAIVAERDLGDPTLMVGAGSGSAPIRLRWKLTSRRRQRMIDRAVSVSFELASQPPPMPMMGPVTPPRVPRRARSRSSVNSRGQSLAPALPRGPPRSSSGQRRARSTAPRPARQDHSLRPMRAMNRARSAAAPDAAEPMSQAQREELGLTPPRSAPRSAPRNRPGAPFSGMPPVAPWFPPPWSDARNASTQTTRQGSRRSQSGGRKPRQPRSASRASAPRSGSPAMTAEEAAAAANRGRPEKMSKWRDATTSSSPPPRSTIAVAFAAARAPRQAGSKSVASGDATPPPPAAMTVQAEAPPAAFDDGRGPRPKKAGGKGPCAPQVPQPYYGGFFAPPPPPFAPPRFWSAMPGTETPEQAGAAGARVHFADDAATNGTETQSVLRRHRGRRGRKKNKPRSTDTSEHTHVDALPEEGESHAAAGGPSPAAPEGVSAGAAAAMGTQGPVSMPTVVSESQLSQNSPPNSSMTSPTMAGSTSSFAKGGKKSRPNPNFAKARTPKLPVARMDA